MKKIRWVALDVHADTIAIAVAEHDEPPTFMGVIENTPSAVAKLMRKLTRGMTVRVCYEAATARLNVLLLLASIAFAAVLLVGVAAFEAGVEKRLRASSRKPRVLSLFSVGNLVARSAALVRMRMHDVWKHLETLRRASRELFPRIPELEASERLRGRWVSHEDFCANCGWNSHLPQ